MSVSKLFKETKYRGEVLGTVVNSVEFQRIAALPRRVLDLDNVQDVTASGRFSRPRSSKRQKLTDCSG